MRIETVSPPPLSLHSLYEESTSQIPILLISSPGADPSKELQEYASKTIGSGNYDELAMGGGQQEIAMQMVRNAATHGTWLCLKNLHLVVAWLPALEKELSSLQAHVDFRLWLTSESHPAFPSILLQQSLKVAYESPPGVKKNLQRAFEVWGPDDFSSDSPVRSRLLFLLACFHAVVQERRTYIPQGWTKFYEFSYGDMRAGTYVIEAITAGARSKGPEGLDWETIHGLMEDAIYGGRIDNIYDLRVLRAYLRIFFKDSLVKNDSARMEIISGTSLRMPNNPDYKGFVNSIGNLSDVDAPFVFNLPDNIERSLQRTSSQAVIKQLRLLSVVDAEGQRYDRDKWRSQLNPTLELWQQLLSSSGGGVSRRPTDRAADARGGSTRPSSMPIDDFVDMESDLATDLCSLVDSSLSALKKVLFGSGLLTPIIQSVAKALLADSVPGEWNKRWEGPEKPQLWLRELTRKRAAIAKWKASCAKGNLLDEPVCLGTRYVASVITFTWFLPNYTFAGDLFNPATYINALRQQTARKLSTAIDRVRLICGWDRDTKQVKSTCVIPCTLSGLYLQGATFHGGILRESASDANEISSAPNVTIGFIEDKLRREDGNSRDETIGIPLYLTPTREELLAELMMPIEGDFDKWVLAGVALFMTEDE
jgi:dynein heavy chain 2